MNCSKIKCIFISLSPPSDKIEDIKKISNQLQKCIECSSKCKWTIDCLIKKETIKKLQRTLDISRKKFLNSK